jgi:hypothetical protein
MIDDPIHPSLHLHLHLPAAAAAAKFHFEELGHYLTNDK